MSFTTEDHFLVTSYIRKYKGHTICFDSDILLDYVLKVSADSISISFEKYPYFNTTKKNSNDMISGISMLSCMIAYPIFTKIARIASDKRLFCLGLIDKDSTLSKLSKNKIFDKHLAREIYSFI